MSLWTTELLSDDILFKILKNEHTRKSYKETARHTHS